MRQPECGEMENGNGENGKLPKQLCAHRKLTINLNRCTPHFRLHQRKGRASIWALDGALDLGSEKTISKRQLFIHMWVAEHVRQLRSSFFIFVMG